MEPSSTTRSGASRRSASQLVSTIHLSGPLHGRLLQFSSERDANAPVDLALVLDLGDRHAADLAGAGDMRAAARLQIDAAVLANGNETNARPCPSAA
jgi:hypothetical protein